MTRDADFRRLNRALDEAVAALPEGACGCQTDATLRRQCREMVLLLLQVRERGRRLMQMFSDAGRGPGP